MYQCIYVYHHTTSEMEENWYKKMILTAFIHETIGLCCHMHTIMTIITDILAPTMWYIVTHK